MADEKPATELIESIKQQQATVQAPQGGAQPFPVINVINQNSNDTQQSQQQEQKQTTIVHVNSGGCWNGYWVLFIVGFCFPILWCVGICGICSTIPGERVAGFANLIVSGVIGLILFIIIIAAVAASG